MTFNKRNIMAYAIDYVDTNDRGSSWVLVAATPVDHVKRPAREAAG